MPRESEALKKADKLSEKIKKMREQWAEEDKKRHAEAQEEIERINAWGKQRIDKLNKIFEKSSQQDQETEREFRKQQKLYNEMKAKQTRFEQQEAKKAAERESHPLGLDSEDAETLSKLLSVLFNLLTSKKFIFSMLLGAGFWLAGFGLPFIIATMLVSLSASSILSFARRKLLERFYDPNANTANDDCYFELGKKGQDSWSQYLAHTFTASRSFLPFTQAGLAYQAGRRQKELEQYEDPEQARASNRP